MKIVYIGKYFDPYIGGIETVSSQLCEGMVRLGHEVSIIASHEKRLLGSEYVQNKIKVIKLIKFGTLISTPLCLWSAKQINGLKPDIIHFHLPNPLPLFLLKNLEGYKVATYHASILNKGVFGNLYSKKYKKQLELFDKIVVTSQKTTKEKIFLNLNIKKSKIVTIPLGVKTHNNIKTNYSNDNFKLVFSGRLVEYKGLKYLINAMKEINAELIIIGRGPLRAKLKAQVVNLGLEDKINFIEPMSREKLFEFVKACDLFVLPSITEAEAFGMSALEAMSIGLPIVTTNLSSGVSEINIDGKTGVIVAPGSRKSLVAGINKVLNKSILKTMGNNSRLRFLENYKLENMLSSYDQLYKDTLLNK